MSRSELGAEHPDVAGTASDLGYLLTLGGRLRRSGAARRREPGNSPQGARRANIRRWAAHSTSRRTCCSPSTASRKPGKRPRGRADTRAEPAGGSLAAGDGRTPAGRGAAGLARVRRRRTVAGRARKAWRSRHCGVPRDRAARTWSSFMPRSAGRTRRTGTETTSRRSCNRRFLFDIPSISVPISTVSIITPGARGASRNCDS